MAHSTEAIGTRTFPALGTRRRGKGVGLDVRHQLRVNPITCTGHGLCAELLPEMIELDPWGYPILSSRPVPRDVMDHAKRAVKACPTLALQLTGKHS
jgi:ferredoxin